MTVEHARTMHSPNQHIHTLNDRVWRLERDRCDCTKIPTKQPDDIVLNPPAPPPSSVASSVLYGRRLADNKLVRLNSNGQFEDTGLKFSGNYVFSQFVLNGWTAWNHPDFWDPEAPKVIINHIEDRWPTKTLVVTDPQKKHEVHSITAWGETPSSIAVFGQLIPKSASGEVRITQFGPTHWIKPGLAYRVNSNATVTFYRITGGSIVAGQPVSIPNHENWDYSLIPDGGVIRSRASLEFPGSNRVRLWTGTSPFTYRGEANGVAAISTKHILWRSARVSDIDGKSISSGVSSVDISSTLSVEEIRQAGASAIGIVEHGGDKWAIRTGDKFIMMDGTQVLSSVQTTGIYVFDGYPAL